MIDAIKRGDELAFRQVYDQFGAKVHGYFMKKTRSAEDARDLVQTTFLKLWKYRTSLSSEYLLEQQLFHICRTVYIDYLRKQARMLKVVDNRIRQLPEAVPNVSISTEFDIRSRLAAALADMPELRKKVFEMNRLQGYSYQEIARHLSISVKSVDNNLAKAIKFLRKTMMSIVTFLF